MDLSAHTILKLIEDELASEADAGVKDPSRAVDAARALVQRVAADASCSAPAARRGDVDAMPRRRR